MTARDLRARAGDATTQRGIQSPDAGRVSLTAQLPAQRRADASGEAAEAVPMGALTTSALPAPVQRKMEDAFDFDFSGVRIHEGTAAPALGASAYTQGSDIYFAPGAYDPHSERGQGLVGHELAHVVQQSEGRVAATTQFKGVDLNDDGGLEREADEWGERAARGESVGRSGPGGVARTAASAAAQRKVIQRSPVSSHWGRFVDTTYVETSTGVDVKLDFEPSALVDSTSIGFTQSVHTTVGGTDTVIDPSQRDRMVPSGETGAGSRIDRVTTANNPIYGAGDIDASGGLGATAPNSGSRATTVGPGSGQRRYQLGHRYTDSSGEHVKNAEMADGPSGGGRNSSRTFETTVLALAGTQEGTYYGSVSWGYDRDENGTVTKRPFALVSEGVPSAGFLNAAERWNDSTVRGTLETSASPTELFDRPGGSVVASLAQGTSVTDRGAVSLSGVMYRRVNVTSGDHNGTAGVIRVSELRDRGDGGATANLPTPDVHVLSADQALNDGVDGPYRDFDLLPAGTRVVPTGETHGIGPMDKLWVRVVDGPHTGREGFIDRAILQPE